MKKDFGTVKFEGKEYALTQDAYVDNYGTDGEVRYYAHATDADGKEYRVVWETTKDFDDSQKLHGLEEELEMLNRQKSYDYGEIARIAELEAEIEEMESEGISAAYCEDESNACDWDSPINVEAE